MQFDQALKGFAKTFKALFHWQYEAKWIEFLLMAFPGTFSAYSWRKIEINPWSIMQINI